MRWCITIDFQTTTHTKIIQDTYVSKLSTVETTVTGKFSRENVWQKYIFRNSFYCLVHMKLGKYKDLEHIRFISSHGVVGEGSIN